MLTVFLLFIFQISKIDFAEVTNKFKKYPAYFDGDKCHSHCGDRGSMSYVLKSQVHYPHISVGDEDIKRDGFHITIAKGKHIFFKAQDKYPFCRPEVYDRVTMDELWGIHNYARQYATELKEYRN